MTQEKTQTAAAAPAKKHRLLKISILRYNPQDPDSVPHMQTYELEESDSMTLFIALNDLNVVDSQLIVDSDRDNSSQAAVGNNFSDLNVCNNHCINVLLKILMMFSVICGNSAARFTNSMARVSVKYSGL